MPPTRSPRNSSPENARSAGGPSETAAETAVAPQKFEHEPPRTSAAERPPARRHAPRRNSRELSMDSGSYSDSYSDSESRSRSPPRRAPHGRRPPPYRRARRRSPSSSYSRSDSSYSSRSPPRSRSQSRSRSFSRSRSLSRSRSPSRSPNRGRHQRNSGGYRDPRRYYRGASRGRSFSPRDERRRGHGRDTYRADDNWRNTSRPRHPYRPPSPLRRNRPMHRARKAERRRRREAEFAMGKRVRGTSDQPRDLRTVFIWQLAQRVREPDIFDFFSDAGRVRDVRLVRDRSSSKHKSAGYVEFYDTESVAKAVAMNGTILCGFPVAVKASVEHNRGTGGIPPGSGGPVDGLQQGPVEGLQQGANRLDTAVVGWSNRRPRQNDLQQAGAYAGNVPGPMPSSSPQLVSIEQLKKLLNPLGLPLPARPASVPLPGQANSVAADRSQQNGLQAVAQVPLPTAADAGAMSRGSVPGAFTRLYVGSVAFELSENDLREVFEGCGPISSLQLQRDASGRSRGYGFVEFVSHESAKKALDIDGMELANRKLKVNLASQENRVMPGAKLGDVGGTGVVPLPGPLGQIEGGLGDVTGELDEGKDGGLALNASQRVMLMQQLSRGETIGNGPATDSAKLPVSAEGSKCLMLCNMFNPLTEPANFELELAEDVRDECAAEYGTVKHVHVEAKSQGVVFIQFDSLEGAEKAKTGLNGRWFGGRKIQAFFVGDADYSKKFAKAAE